MRFGNYRLYFFYGLTKSQNHKSWELMLRAVGKVLLGWNFLCTFALVNWLMGVRRFRSPSALPPLWLRYPHGK